MVFVEHFCLANLHGILMLAIAAITQRVRKTEKKYTKCKRYANAHTSHPAMKSLMEECGIFNRQNWIGLGLEMNVICWQKRKKT